MLLVLCLQWNRKLVRRVGNLATGSPSAVVGCGERGLTLEREIDEHLAAAPRHRVQQIGELLEQDNIDVAAGAQRELRPVERLGWLN